MQYRPIYDNSSWTYYVASAPPLWARRRHRRQKLFPLKKVMYGLGLVTARRQGGPLYPKLHRANAKQATLLIPSKLLCVNAKQSTYCQARYRVLMPRKPLSANAKQAI